MDFKNIEPIVRVNSVDSGLAEDDLNVILAGQKLRPTLMLPKVENPSHLDWVSGLSVSYISQYFILFKLYLCCIQFAEKLSFSIKDKVLEEPFNLIIYTESAIGLINLVEVCRRGEQLTSQGAPFQLAGVVFGSDDFVADIGLLVWHYFFVNCVY